MSSRKKIRRIPHPAYSPDLAPSDFFLFDHIKRKLTEYDIPKRPSLKSAITTVQRNRTRNPHSCLRNMDQQARVGDRTRRGLFPSVNEEWKMMRENSVKKLDSAGRIKPNQELESSTFQKSVQAATFRLWLRWIEISKCKDEGRWIQSRMAWGLRG
jgi:hypothetical protein